MMLQRIQIKMRMVIRTRKISKRSKDKIKEIWITISNRDNKMSKNMKNKTKTNGKIKIKMNKKSINDL
jgi:hypothetical protein